MNDTITNGQQIHIILNIMPSEKIFVNSSYLSLSVKLKMEMGTKRQQPRPKKNLIYN